MGLRKFDPCTERRRKGEGVGGFWNNAAWDNDD